jgi:hypothetical protein
MARPARNTTRKLSLAPSTAKRIARAVVAIERSGGSIAAAGRQSAGSDGEIVRGTFSGSWAKGATKTVTDATLSAVTYEAKNYVASLLPSGEMGCQLCYTAGEWVLVTWDWQSLSGYSGSTQQVLTHNTSGQLVWVSTTACT